MHPGQLAHGDGLLLFTDGLVETAQRDIALGIDKLPAWASGSSSGGFDGGAAPADRLDGADQRRPGPGARAPPLTGGPAPVSGDGIEPA